MVKAFGSSVKGVLAVVLGYLVLLAVNGERCVSNAVGVASERGSHGVSAESLVLLDVVVVAHYVGVVAVSVRGVDTHNVAGQVGDLGGYPAIGDSIEGYFFPVDFRFKV